MGDHRRLMARTVFISYGGGDRDVAERLATELRTAGLDVWFAEWERRLGGSIVDRINKGLTDASHLILCCGAEGPGPWVDVEWMSFLARQLRGENIVLLTALLDGGSPPAILAQLDYVDLAKDFDAGVQDLIREIVSPKAVPMDAALAVPRVSQRAIDEVERQYRARALAACDIIDLTNLPETDRHIAAEKLALRRLYVPSRVRPAPWASSVENDEDDDPPIWLEEYAITPDETVGELLTRARRVVVLGDPGAGKSTLVRWLATAYLLRADDDPGRLELPGAQALPDVDWLPVVIRCRDLDEETLKGWLDDILLSSLRKAEFSADDAVRIRDAIRARLVAGTALLLIDGLDEIVDPGLRAHFARQLETVSTFYPDVPIVVTSRIAGYRDIGRLGRDFEHVTVADLSSADKDDFARRWCEVTEPTPDRAARAAAGLIADIHSNSQIERLTANPMLLTLMALVRRSRLGKLPSRRVDLYASAVEVLLNWRPGIDEPLDHDEAIPQLEYLAYAMCEQGERRLREDEVHALLRRMRQEHPELPAVHQHTVAEFVRLLERRTGILVESERIWHRGREMSVFEFRHLSFQEYLTGLALIDGCSPGRDRSLTLAEAVAPLAVPEARGRHPFRRRWQA
jgi:TIR domain-containing protein/NACHT domain-containing protein